MKPDDIISYTELVAEERANLQKGMNYGIGKTYFVFLMSVRSGAPYLDQIDQPLRDPQLK
jgi:allophanate hydrolase subunit 1